MRRIILTAVLALTLLFSIAGCGTTAAYGRTQVIENGTTAGMYNADTNGRVSGYRDRYTAGYRGNYSTTPGYRSGYTAGYQDGKTAGYRDAHKYTAGTVPGNASSGINTIIR